MILTNLPEDDPHASTDPHRPATVLGEQDFRLRRLAELGMAQAKLTHDLRNAMAPALMVADRLCGSADPAVAHAAQVIVAALEQASAQIAVTLDFTTEVPPALTRARLPFARVIEEVAAAIGREFPALRIAILIPADIEINADKGLIQRAFGHMLRTAAKAQAKTLTVRAETQADQLHIVQQDDGRPFRDQDQANPFSAFSGAFRYGSSGLGLIIARDLIEAHEGSLTLLSESGAAATAIRIILPLLARN